jgi:N-acylglucosamine 2-epimerase
VSKLVLDYKIFPPFRQRYETELLQSVIPFWIKNCVDTKYGGYLHCLDRDGSVYDTDKYMWMEWRIVYTLATLSRYPHFKNPVQENTRHQWLEYAKQGFDFLTKFGQDEHGMYYFALNRSGQPLVAPYNIYSEAFATMGAAALYKATKIEKYKQASLTAMNHYLSRVDNPKGKWNKRLPASPARLNFGIFMILANLGTVLKECLGISDYDQKVTEAVNIVLDRFWDEEKQVLFENINLDYIFDLESPDGRHINPGHALEAMWFILQYAERNYHAELIPKVIKIIKAMLQFGWDPQFGGLFYFMDVLGKPHMELQWDMKLWWVHNEAMVASLYGFRITKDLELWDWFVKLDKWSWDHFRDPQYGEWFAYLNRRGEVTHTLKGGKWKCFFHLPRYLWTCMEQFKILEKEPIKS